MVIEILNSKDFNKVYALMEISFPEDERRTYSEQKELLSNSEYKIYVSREPQTHQIQAFAAVWEFAEFVFIEHLAVNPKYRNKGIGAEFLNAIVKSLDKMVCLEVEPPINEMATRRIGFYERNNFFFNEYEYMQPAISKGRKAIQLFIMTSGCKITKTEFENIKNIIYKRVYRV